MCLTKAHADKLAVLQADRWSMFSMPLVEYDTLQQSKGPPKKGTNFSVNIARSPTSCQY